MHSINYPIKYLHKKPVNHKFRVENGICDGTKAGKAKETVII